MSAKDEKNGWTRKSAINDRHVKVCRQRCGGHGFGLRPSDHPSSAWPKRCEEWLKNRGLLERESGK